MFTQEKVKAIENVLPHGSGINYDWKINTKGKTLKFDKYE